jgi:hypothetical protein
VTDEAENVPEDSRAAVDFSWETLKDARRKRHDLQRLLFAQRVAEGMDARIVEALGGHAQ